MTRHLSSEEITAALDRALPPARMAHLSACDSCQLTLSELGRAAREVMSAKDVPEPSPLFWDHLTDRIREATGTEPVMSRASWWQRGWRPLAAVGAAAAVAALVLALRVSPVPPSDSGSGAGAGTNGSEDIAWRVIGEMASAMSAEDVRQVVASAPDPPAAVNDLTPTEREAFVRLLKVELGGIQ